MIIDEKKYFDLALHFRECQDQSGYFEADSLTTLRVWVDYLERVERIAPRQWETITRVPLAWVVKWQNKYPFFTEEDWTHEHLPQEQRLCLSHGPYFQVGDRVQLHDNVAGYFTRVFGATYTVVEVFDHHADQVEAGGLPEYRASEGRIYRLDGLSVLVSHQALYREEAPVLVRLFQRHQKYDVRIVSYAHAQRQAVSLGPQWELAPGDGAWLHSWWSGCRPIYLYFTVEQAQAKLASYGLTEKISHLEHATLHALTGEVESVYACTSDGQRIWQFWYSPWAEDEEDVLYFDSVETSAPSFEQSANVTE